MAQITTPESAAYELLLLIATAEKKDLAAGNVSDGMTRADRKWILETYYESIFTVKGGAPSGYQRGDYEKRVR